MHSKNIAHRDLKPENILVEYKDIENKQINIKIADFGYACYFTDEIANKSCTAGTFLYQAPELHLNK